MGKTSFSTSARDGFVEADGFSYPPEQNKRGQITQKVAVAAVDTGGGFFSWQNPESTDIIVTGVYLNITTQSSGSCTVDIGSTASSATTSSDNLIDGLSVAAAGLFSNFDDAGTNGKKDQLVAAGKWVTGSVASGAAAGVAGYVYIRYFQI